MISLLIGPSGIETQSQAGARLPADDF